MGEYCRWHYRKTIGLKQSAGAIVVRWSDYRSIRYYDGTMVLTLVRTVKLLNYKDLHRDRKKTAPLNMSK